MAVDKFEQVGSLEVMNWHQYTEFLTKWASQTAFETKRRRISELPGLVFLELQETNTTETQSTVVNSLSVYEFNDDGKIRHLDIYLQRELSASRSIQRARLRGSSGPTRRPRGYGTAQQGAVHCRSSTIAAPAVGGAALPPRPARRRERGS